MPAPPIEALRDEIGGRPGTRGPCRGSISAPPFQPIDRTVTNRSPRSLSGESFRAAPAAPVNGGMARQV